MKPSQRIAHRTAQLHCWMGGRGHTTPGLLILIGGRLMEIGAQQVEHAIGVDQGVPQVVTELGRGLLHLPIEAAKAATHWVDELAHTDTTT